MTQMQNFIESIQGAYQRHTSWCITWDLSWTHAYEIMFALTRASTDEIKNVNIATYDEIRDHCEKLY